MKENWEYKRLGEVATFINGYPFKPSEWKTNGTPIIRIQNLNNPLAEYNYCDKTLDERYLVKSGDVLISWSGSLGVFEWSGTNAFLNQHIFKVLFNKGEIDKFYFKYVVSSRIEEMKGKVHGITMQHITKSEFDKIMIPIPPLDEQKQIVAELDLLSGVIEKQKAELNELDNLAQSTFYDMFGDPIENPKGWEIKNLGDVCFPKSIIGRASKAFGFSEEIFYIDIASIDNKKNSITSYTQIVMSEAPSRAQQCVKKNDILISLVRPNLRNVAIVADDKENLVASSGFCVLRADRKVLPQYVFRFVCSEEFTNYLVSLTTGANYPAVREDDVRNARIPVPPLALQQSFADKIASIEKQKAALTQSIAETQKLLDYTMDKYFG